MHWESLNEYMEEAFKAAYEKAYWKYSKSFTNKSSKLDIEMTDEYVNYLEERFPNKTEKIA